MSIDEQVKQITETIKSVPTRAAQQRLAGELGLLTSRYNDATATPEQKAAAEARLEQLCRDAEIATQVSLWSTFSMILVGLVLFLFFGGIFLYLNGMRPIPYWTIEATRPIIVYTLIVAMLGFGGLFMVRALFSDEDDATMQNRFRYAREVFLIFSGVFSTVIGFYFGTGTGTDGPAAGPPVLAAAILGQDGLVSVTVSKGRAPYQGTIRLVGEEEDRSLAAVGNVLSVPLNKATDCPAGARINVRDADSRAVNQTIAQTAEQLLAQQWEGCRRRGTTQGNVPSNGNSVNATGNAL